MTNPRLDKVKADIEKTKEKISELQSKLRLLERQKTDIENGQIIALIRSERISDAELSALMMSLRKEESGVITDDAKATEITKGQEEPQNANIDED